MMYTKAVEEHGSQRAAARALGIPRGTLQERLAKEKAGVALNTEGSVLHLKKNGARVELSIEDGVVVIFSDAHFWPGDESTAYLALLQFIKNHKPVAIINNGDAFDGATVSRWPAANWEESANRPSVGQELEACKAHLTPIVAACTGRLIWTLGNHDSRYEAKLLQTAPQYAGVSGMHLKDHFPEWEHCWSCWINDEVVVKHRFRSGAQAGHNNTMNAGKTIVTGHTHHLEVKPFTDYTGTRYGVQTGTLSALGGAKFAYSEDNPSNHRSGFVILTFRGGHLMQPETVAVVDHDHVDFRGKLWRVR